MSNFIFLTMALVCLMPALSFQADPPASSGGQIQLATILPKLQAIHEDSQSLLVKNNEMRVTILEGLKAQTEAKIKASLESTTPISVTTTKPPKPSQPTPGKPEEEIDFSELEEFNKWVGVNLEYAVKNTLATIETLKEEAQQNNGTIDYSEQAIKDGIEGVKYWQSAVIFQDKTLKNEKYNEE